MHSESYFTIVFFHVDVSQNLKWCPPPPKKKFFSIQGNLAIFISQSMTSTYLDIMFSVLFAPMACFSQVEYFITINKGP